VIDGAVEADSHGLMRNRFLNELAFIHLSVRGTRRRIALVLGSGVRRCMITR
jgi:D-aminopeptidase